MTVHRSSRESGFSLIDIMVAMLVMGIVMAGAMPLLSNVSSSMRLGQGARDVERELQGARLKAVTANRPIRVRFNCPTAGSYRRVELVGTPSVPDAADSNANRCQTSQYPYPPTDRNPLTVPNHDGPTRTLPEGVSFGSVSTLEFWPDGSVHKQSSAENPWLTVPVAGAALTLTKGTEVKTITVNGLGKIQLQQTQ